MSEPKAKSGKTKFSAIASTVLWCLGFGLCFVIPANSKFSWLADFLLLLGFCPLLWLYPAGWPWLVFGVLNTGIGIILEIGYQLPAEALPAEVNQLRLALKGTHPTLVWILTGFVCTIFGIFRMIKNGVLYFGRRAQESAQNQPEGTAAAVVQPVAEDPPPLA